MMLIRINLWAFKVAKYWLRILVIAGGLFILPTLLAPVLMEVGLAEPAKLIYGFYSPICHQLAFRSVFLFGEQPVYPRYNVQSGLVPFEAYAKDLPEFAPNRIMAGWGQVGDIYALSDGYMAAAKAFVGNPQMGYKLAICERDIAIYGALVLGGVLYGRKSIKRRVRPCPLWLYGLLGLAPIAIDGFSQLLSYPPFDLLPIRETSPALRIITGGLFGLMTAWLVMPYLDAWFADRAERLESKLQRAGVLFNPAI